MSLDMDLLIDRHDYCAMEEEGYRVRLLCAIFFIGKLREIKPPSCLA